MQMTLKRYNDIKKSIDTLLNEQPTFEWQELVAHIEKSIKIKNWMQVRGVLQEYLNNKTVERDYSNIRKELYFNFS